MKAVEIDPVRIRSAWEGRVSGCQLGKPVEVLSMARGREALEAYLQQAEALPLRDYVPLVEGTLVEQLGRACCRGEMSRAEPDDDINYTVLALLLLEEKGAAFETVDVARAWLRLLPAGATWTAERQAYRTLLARTGEHFPVGGEAGFDLAECSDHAFNDWIGAQIRADLYGWVCPGRPALAAELARRDASLSHRGEGVHGAAFVAALGAAIPTIEDLEAAAKTRSRGSTSATPTCRPSTPSTTWRWWSGRSAPPVTTSARRSGRPSPRAGTRTATVPRSAASSGSPVPRSLGPGRARGRAASGSGSPATASSASTSSSIAPWRSLARSADPHSVRRCRR
jgi:hypothetical protein